MQKTSTTPKNTKNLSTLILCLVLLLATTSCQSSRGQLNTISTSNPTALSQTETIPYPTSTSTKVPVASPLPTPSTFNGEQAYQDAIYQLDLGPRTPGSQAHQQVEDWISTELEKAGWQVEKQQTTYAGQPVHNIIGKWGSGTPWVVIGAHYDSRLQADQDPDPAKRTQPVPGANDGASGVAVLLELARTLPGQMTLKQTGDLSTEIDPQSRQIWLVFLDSEDNGDIRGWDWLLGSRAFVENLKDKPDAAVIIDMIGDKDLNIFYETNSNQIMNQEIWAQAASLGYQKQFIPVSKYPMLDDHIPFIEAGIPAVDIIDFDYPYWHTTEDTADKISASSLKAVGDTLTAWLQNGSKIFNQDVQTGYPTP